MIYLKSINLPNKNVEDTILFNYVKNISNSYYPFYLFPEKQFEHIEFEPITIFYGGNGSGKTTLLKIISETIKASKRSANRKGDLFESYVEYCEHYYEMINHGELMSIKFISSDDVFEYLLDLKAINSGVNRKKEALVEEYYEYKNLDGNALTIDQYEEIKNKVDANRNSVSKYVRTRLKNNNVIQESNGETALDFWQDEITENSLYIIDEPENSLSAESQLKLKSFIEESARFFHCQFIIATHSPFLLAMNGAKIYDLDTVPVEVKKWTELENVKTYNNFFKEHSSEFEQNN